MEFEKDPKLQGVDERRKEWRLEASGSFLVEFTKKAFPPLKGPGDGRDLSLSGVRFATGLLLKKGDHLDLVINFPQGFPAARKVQVQAGWRVSISLRVPSVSVSAAS